LRVWQQTFGFDGVEMNVAMDIARDYSCIASDGECIVVISGNVLTFSHDGWSCVIACAARGRVVSASSSLRGRRIEGDGSRGTVLRVSAKKG
jgi:hypothetical protein